MNGNKSVTAVFTANTAPPPPSSTTYSISGSLGTTGATVSISGGGSCSVSSSNYTCVNVPKGVAVTITPSKSGGAFTPTSRPYNLSISSTLTQITSLNFIFAVNTAPPITPTLTVSSPSINSNWTSSNGPVIQWSSANIPSSNTITVELLTPSGGSVPGFSSFTTANDGSESSRLTNSSVASGSYYFRLKTTVNGLVIYGGSGVFQFMGATQPPTTPTPTITVTAPGANYVWTKANSHPVNWTSTNIPATNNIKIELFYPNNIQVPSNLFNNYITANDGNRDVTLLSVLPVGAYYFRLSTTVNDQIVYGGSSVFRVD
jgi:hypothetical protein